MGNSITNLIGSFREVDMTLATEGTRQRVARVVVEEKMVAMVSSFGRRDSMRMAVYLLLAVVVVSFHTKVKAASFDCEKAKSAVEKMICADAELSKLDEEVAQAYGKAKTSISNEKWKELIQKRQKQWLRERNTCDEAICVKNIYESRLASLKLALAATEEVIAQQNAIKRGPCGDWIFRDGATGHEPPLCYELLKRLNRYAQDGDVVPPDCGGIVLTSYPKFTLPPWEEVDIRQHQDLLYILMVYRANGHRGDRVLKELVNSPVDRRYVDDAKAFIEKGGRLRIWRTRLVENYRGGNGYVPAPPGNQTLLQMYIPRPKEKSMLPCDDKPVPITDYSNMDIFMVSPDLSGIDPLFTAGMSGIFSGMDLLLYEGKPILIGLDRLWWHGKLSLNSPCAFEFVPWRK